MSEDTKSLQELYDKLNVDVGELKKTLDTITGNSGGSGTSGGGVPNPELYQNGIYVLSKNKSTLKKIHVDTGKVVWYVNFNTDTNNECINTFMKKGDIHIYFMSGNTIMDDDKNLNVYKINCITGVQECIPIDFSYLYDKSYTKKIHLVYINESNEILFCVRDDESYIYNIVTKEWKDGYDDGRHGDDFSHRLYSRESNENIVHYSRDATLTAYGLNPYTKMTFKKSKTYGAWSNGYNAHSIVCENDKVYQLTGPVKSSDRLMRLHVDSTQYQLSYDRTSFVNTKFINFSFPFICNNNTMFFIIEHTQAGAGIIGKINLNKKELTLIPIPEELRSDTAHFIVDPVDINNSLIYTMGDNKIHRIKYDNVVKKEYTNIITEEIKTFNKKCNRMVLSLDKKSLYVEIDSKEIVKLSVDNDYSIDWSYSLYNDDNILSTIYPWEL